MTEKQFRARQEKLYQMARKRALQRVQTIRIGRIKKLYMAKRRQLDILVRQQEMGR